MLTLTPPCLFSLTVCCRLAQAEQILEDRLKDASKRHGDHIKSVRGKASNENTKVRNAHVYLVREPREFFYTHIL